MPTTPGKFISKCEEIVQAKPAYKNGASSRKECDCIGMDKYAFRECNVPFSSTGTNYSARNQMRNFRRINSADDLTPGAAVFKARSPGDPHYDLPAKYQPGGAGYNKDLTDYYHIGTVASTSPLRIIHMTSPTAKVDTDWHKWDFVGLWDAKYITYTDPGAPEDSGSDSGTSDPMYARTIAESGSTVNLRRSPSFAAPLLERVPIGSRVEVLTEGAEWTKVKYKGKTGYILNAFLQIEGTSAVYIVTISGLSAEQVQTLRSMYKDSEIDVQKVVS